jgi:hypothetical protein
MGILWQNPDRPRDIPQRVFTHLVLKMGAEGDRLSRLKAVTRPALREAAPVLLIRLYEPDTPPGLKVEDFTSLDGHPEAVAYEGWLDPVSGEIQFAVNPRSPV